MRNRQPATNRPSNRIFDTWLSKPVIPVFSHPKEHGALLAQAAVLFLQGVELADLAGVLEELERPELKPIPLLVHIDLVPGLNADDAGLRFLRTMPRVDGIVTVRPHLIAAARQLGLHAVLRMFLQDSRAVERGLAIAANNKPDAIELLPAIAAIETAEAFRQLAVPRLAGGLVHDAATIQRVLASGCRCVSASDPDLWQLNAR